MNTLYTFLILTLIAWGMALPGQSTFYDFEDANAHRPHWTGDTTDFEVRDGYLQLSDTSSTGISRIVLPTPTAINADTVIYEFLLEQDFSPSDSNDIVIKWSNPFLADEAAFSIFWFASDLGYVRYHFPEIPGYRSSIVGELRRRLVNYRHIRVRLTRVLSEDTVDPTFLWTLGVDYSGGKNYIDQDEIMRLNHAYSEFHLEVEHSDNLAGKVRIDDVNVRSIFRADTNGPRIVSNSFPSAYEIEIVFNDTLDQVVANDLANYYVFPQGDEINELVEVTSGLNSVRLRMRYPFSYRGRVHVFFNRVTNHAGFSSRGISAYGQYSGTLNPLPGSVILNELMINPSPPIGLPEFEYVELYNSTDSDVYLKEMSLASGGFLRKLPNVVFYGKSYLVLALPEAVASIRATGANVLAFDLPVLGDGGDGVILKNEGDGTMNHQQLNFNRRWYDDPNRDGGGYSLEYIGAGDSNSSCNWKASQDPLGGTPGRENSVSGWHDTIPPDIESFSFTEENIRVSFNEAVSFFSLDTSHFTFSPEAPIYDVVATISNDLLISTQLEAGIDYTLKLDRIMYDCAGNYPLKPLFVDFTTEGDTTTSIEATRLNASPQLTLVNPLPGVSDTDQWQVIYAGVRSSFQLSGEVYDIHGRLVQHLPSVTLYQREGVIDWHGRGALRSGYYSVLLRLVNEQGPTLLLPKKVVIIR